MFSDLLSLRAGFTPTPTVIGQFNRIVDLGVLLWSGLTAGPVPSIAICADLSSRSQSEESRDDRGEEHFLTLSDVATRLKVNEDTIRRLFINEPGVVIICFP